MTITNHQMVAELMRNGTLELSPRDERQVAEARDALPFGTRIYLPALPKKTLLSDLGTLCALHAAGYDPVPHLAARRIPSRQALREFLERAVSQAGVRRVLLIGGDLAQPAGPYADSAALLRDRLLAEAGIQEVGFAGHPEGHPCIPVQALQSALQKKLSLASEQGLGSYVVTQFSFAPTRIVDYCAALARSLPDVPVYVGMAGPSSTARLIRYAKRCGVSASLRALSDSGFKAARLLIHTDPREQLSILAHYCAAHDDNNIVGVHIFSFGGFVESARWMRRMYSRIHTESCL